MFHVNPNTGEPRRCSAVKGNCPYATAELHFTSASEARVFYENQNEAFITKDSVSSVTYERFESLEAFAAYRNSDLYTHRQFSVDSFGMEPENIFAYSFATTKASSWDSFEVEQIVVADYKVRTSQEAVFSWTVAHYIANPLESSTGSSDVRDSTVVNAILDEENNTIHVLDGNHRCAAALLSGEAIPMRLMPLSIATEDYDWLVDNDF